MSILYIKNKKRILSQCASCEKGIFNICGIICEVCKKKSCKNCGNIPLITRYDEKGNISCMNSIGCIPKIWKKNIYHYRYTINNAIMLRNTLTALASACRGSNINIYCANIILSYYDKGEINNQKIAYILEKFVFLRKHFFML